MFIIKTIGNRMPLYNLEQYHSEDTNTLDLSDIIPEKLFLNGRFVEFTAELNAYLSRMPDITQLTISSSLLKEIIGIDFNSPNAPITSQPQAQDSTGCVISPLLLNNVSKLKIKGNERNLNSDIWYCMGRSFYYFLTNNPQLKVIDCRNDMLSESSTIGYPKNNPNEEEPFLTLIHSGKQSQDFSYANDLLFPCAIHNGLLEYYYKMTKRDLAFYYEWTHLKEGKIVQGLPAVKNSTKNERLWRGLNHDQAFSHNGVDIPKIDLPNLIATAPEQLTFIETWRREMNTVLQASFFMGVASRLFDQARNKANLCFTAIILAGLIAVNMPTNVVIAASIGIVSAIGFYALGRNSILPTRENAMQPYNSLLGSYRIG